MLALPFQLDTPPAELSSRWMNWDMPFPSYSTLSTNVTVMYTSRCYDPFRSNICNGAVHDVLPECWRMGMR